MTSVRQGFIFCFEKDFKKGCDNDETKWIAPPPGSYFSSTSGRNTAVIRGTGDKNWQTSASGSFSGSWDWTFMLDYKYLEPLLLMMETVNEKTVSEENFADGKPVEGSTGKYKYVFKKANKTRIPSFCVRRKILNTIAGGPKGSDETTELYGCIVQNVSFSRSATTSQIQVSMGGVYADEKMVLSELKSTDYQEYNGQIAEYTCVLLGDKEKDNAIDNAIYVGNNESLSISIQNNAGLVTNLCNAFPEAYYEGYTHYQVSTTIYSNNPEMYKTRVYGGGVQPKAVTEESTGEGTGETKPKTYRPKSKGLLPLPKMFIATYDGEVTDRSSPGETPVATAYNTSTNSILFDITDAIFKSMKWQSGEGARLVDAMSSVDCKSIDITVITDQATCVNYIQQN